MCYFGIEFQSDDVTEMIFAEIVFFSNSSEQLTYLKKAHMRKLAL